MLWNICSPFQLYSEPWTVEDKCKSMSLWGNNQLSMAIPLKSKEKYSLFRTKSISLSLPYSNDIIII